MNTRHTANSDRAAARHSSISQNFRFLLDLNDPTDVASRLNALRWPIVQTWEDEPTHLIVDDEPQARLAVASGNSRTQKLMQLATKSSTTAESQPSRRRGPPTSPSQDWNAIAKSKNIPVWTVSSKSLVCLLFNCGFCRDLFLFDSIHQGATRKA